MNDRDEAVQALNIALAYTGPGAARERILDEAAALARRVLLADEAEVERLTECLEAMNASADILDEKISAMHFECYQVGPDGRERRVYVSDWLPPGTLIPNRPTSGTEDED